MSTYQNLVSEVERKVNETNWRNAALLRFPEVLKKRFSEVVEMPPEMCLIGASEESGFPSDLETKDGKLEFVIAVAFPKTLGIEPFSIPVTASIAASFYRVNVGNHSLLDVRFAPDIDEANLSILANYAADDLRKLVKEFVK